MGNMVTDVCAKSDYDRLRLDKARAALGMGIPLGIPMGMGMGWVYDDSPWACGNSVGISE